MPADAPHASALRATLSGTERPQAPLPATEVERASGGAATRDRKRVSGTFEPPPAREVRPRATQATTPQHDETQKTRMSKLKPEDRTGETALTDDLRAMVKEGVVTLEQALGMLGPYYE